MGNSYADESCDLMVKIVDNLKGTGERLESNTKEAFNTVATDIHRTSADAAPKDTGFLEKNHLSINYGSTEWEAQIWFNAFNDNFDYALWTHTADYKLGKGSQGKSGGSSRFAGQVPVGRGYLSNTVAQGKEAYMEHINQAIVNSLK